MNNNAFNFTVSYHPQSANAETVNPAKRPLMDLLLPKATFSVLPSTKVAGYWQASKQPCPYSSGIGQLTTRLVCTGRPRAQHTTPVSFFSRQSHFASDFSVPMWWETDKPVLTMNISEADMLLKLPDVSFYTKYSTVSHHPESGLSDYHFRILLPSFTLYALGSGGEGQ